MCTAERRENTHGRLIGDHLVHVLVDVEQQRVPLCKLVPVLALGAAELTMIGVELVLDDMKAVASQGELRLSVA